MLSRLKLQFVLVFQRYDIPVIVHLSILSFSLPQIEKPHHRIDDEASDLPVVGFILLPG